MSTLHKALVGLAMAMYADEPCRICGKMITNEDLHGLVYAGYSLNDRSRSAHGSCWNKNIPKDQWAYPVDAVKKND